MKTKSAKEKVTYCSLFFHPGMGISTQEVLRPPCYQEIMAKGDSLRRYPPLMQWVLVPHFLLLTTNKCPTWLAHSSRTRLCLSASCNPSAEFGGLGSVAEFGLRGWWRQCMVHVGHSFPERTMALLDFVWLHSWSLQCPGTSLRGLELWICFLF